MCLARKQTEGITKYNALFFFLLLFSWKEGLQFFLLCSLALIVPLVQYRNVLNISWCYHTPICGEPSPGAKLVENDYFILPVFWQFICQNCNTKRLCQNM